MNDRTRIQSFVTYGLIAVGGLIAALSGLCTVSLIALTLPGTLHPSTPQDYSAVILMFALLIGGPATLFGGWLLHLGRRSRRETPDDFDRIASALTVVTGGLMSVGYLAFAALPLKRLAEALSGGEGRAAQPLGALVGMLFVTCGAATFAALMAWWAFMRFRRAWAAR